MELYFSYYLSVTQTLTFGYIQWAPDDALTGSFLDVVFGLYLRQGMSEKLPPKSWNEFIVASFSQQCLPCGHIRFVKKDMLECEIKVS